MIMKTMIDPWWVYLLQRVAASRAIGWSFVNVFSKVDRWLLPLSGGRVSTSGLFLPTVLLTTVGAKSGLPRTTPLAYVPHGQEMIMIASSAGSQGHPAWYYNLRANPTPKVLISGRWQPFVAREVEGQERAALWHKAVQHYIGYEVYQLRSGGRRIPVLLLSPQGEAASPPA